MESAELVVLDSHILGALTINALTDLVLILSLHAFAQVILQRLCASMEAALH